MIPVLFKEDEQVFSHNGIGALYESLSCDVVEVENGAFTLELEYPVDGEWFEELQDFRIIQAKPNDIDEPHNFRIYEIDKSIDEKSVHVRANTITNDLGSNLITQYKANRATAQQALNGIKNALIEPTNFNFISDIQTKSSSEWVRINPLNAIVGTEGSLVDYWGGDLKRTNRTIYLYSRRGRDKVAVIRPGKNLQGFNMSTSTSGIVTKILPTYSYREVEIPKYFIETLKNGEKRKRRLVNKDESIPEDITVLGDVVESQYINNYPTTHWRSVDYSNDDDIREIVNKFINDRRTEADESETIIDNSGFPKELKDLVKKELDKKATQYFTHQNPGVDIPTVRIDVDMLALSDSPDWEKFAKLETIGLTDTVEVWVEEYNIDVEVRVTEVQYDSLSENVRRFKAGSDKAPRQSSQDKKYADLTKGLNDYITTIENGVNNIMRNTADGLNRKFEGYTEPPAELSSEGDIWFKEIGEGKVEIWIHDGVYWQPLMTEDFGKKLEADIEATQAELEEAKQQAKLDAEKALADAKAHADAEVERINTELSTDIGGAIEIAEQAKADAVTKANQALEGAKAHADAEVQASKEHFDNLIEDVESEVADAQATADSAVEQIDTAVTNAGFTSLDETINNVRGIASGVKSELDLAIDNAGFESLDETLQNMNYITMNAEQSAQQAITDANNAHGLAQTSISEAQTAQANSLTALGQVEDVQEGVSSLSYRVDEVEGELEAKADNTFMTDDGELITLSNAITFNANRFSSDMSRIESRVESLAGEINLVILKNAFEDSFLLDGDIYPNASPSPFHDTMGELISVEEGEQLALSKRNAEGNNAWRLNFYNANGTFIVRLFPDSNEHILTVPEGATKMWVAYPKNSQPQIVRGTSFVPYRPNLADQMTTDEMVLFRNEYDEYADRTERRLSAIDSTGGSLDVLSNRIIQTAEQVTTDMTALINTKVGDDDFTEFYQNEYLETAQEVSRKISLSDIEIGGRNRVLNSGFLSGLDKWNVSGELGYLVDESSAFNITGTVLDITTTNPNQYIYQPNIDIMPNEDYTISWWTINHTGAENGVFLRTENSDTGEISWINPRLYGTNTWSRQSHTFKVNADKVAIYIGVSGSVSLFGRSYFGAIMLNQGNIAADWTLALEDTDAKINHIETEWTQTFDTFSQTVSDNQGKVNKNIQTLEKSLSAINDPVTGRLTIAEQSLNGFRNEVYNQDGSSKITQLANGLSSVVSNSTNTNMLVDSHFKEDNAFSDRPAFSLELAHRLKADKKYTIRIFGSLNVYKSFNIYATGSDLNYANGEKIIEIHDSQDRVEERVVDGVSRYVHERTFTMPESIGNYTHLVFFANPAGSTSFRTYWVSLVEGEIGKDWSPSSKDYLATNSQISHVESSLSIEVGRINALNTKVENNETFINDLTMTPDGFWVRTARYDRATERVEAIATLEQTVEGLQSQVYSADGSSIITQLATGVNSLVTSVSQLEEDGRNLIRRQNELKNIFIGSDGNDLADSYNNRAFYAIHIESGKTYMISRSVSEHSNPIVRIAEYRNNDTFIRRLTTTSETYIYEPSEEVSYIRISYPNDVDIKMEVGDRATPYSPAPEDTATTSQISQLSDNINLRVKEGELLSQINIEAERTLIQSNKLVLDANSVVFTGSAFIPSAQIESLHADKINAGTIDTVRLDATEIVTKGLTADVIEAEHILADTAIIEKLFATKANIDILTAKTAFIDSIKAVEIDASKISSGTIKTARLDATDIVTQGLTANVIEATHIRADNAFYDKIFASSLAVNRLAAQETWISDANIAWASISGTKIMDATIGSAKIANLDVSKIGGRTASFVETNWNLINSRADIDASRLKFTHNDGTSTEIGIDGIKRTTPTDNRNYHYLISIHNFIYGESSNNARWIQLPDDFKGKLFNVHFAIADSMSTANYHRVIQRMVAVKHPNHAIDYDNARVPIIAYKSESLGDGDAPLIRDMQGILVATY